MAYRAWIIAPPGRGTQADVETLRELFAELHPDHRPADVVEHVHGGKAMVDKTLVHQTLQGLAKHDGRRLVWIVGNAHRDIKWCLHTEGRDRTLRIADIWEALADAARAQPTQPLIAVVDVCHAAEGFANLPDNLIAFAACADDEEARADDHGGWLTRCLVEGLRTLPGEITANDLRGFVGRERERRGVGEMRPKVHLSDTRLTVRLNRRPGAAMATQPAPTLDPIVAWKQLMRARHRNLFPIFEAKHATDEVYVELALASEDGMRRERLLRHRLTLPELMSRPSGRWAILGVPGAGKSTLARHLTWDLADASDGPVAVYLSLPGFVGSGAADFFEYAAVILASSHTARPAAKALPRALMQAPTLYLLLDGLDEVAGADVKRVRDLIRTLPADVPNAHIAVFSRVAGFRTVPGFETVKVQALDKSRQRRLLSKWLTPAVADRAWAHLERRPVLAELAGAPLLLSLIALLFQKNGGLPHTRVALYHDALTLLFERGYSATEPEAMPSPGTSRTILRHLSLALQSRGGEAWDFDELVRTLRLLEDGVIEVDPAVLKQWEVPQTPRRRLSGWWARRVGWLRGLFNRNPTVTQIEHDPQAPDITAMHVALHGPRFEELNIARQEIREKREDWLELIGRCTGVLAAQDGYGEPWRYLHRALRDALCAEQMATLIEHNQATLIDFARTLGDDDQIGRWAETFAQLCVMASATEPLLIALIEASDTLGRRALAEVDGLSPNMLVSLLMRTQWDGEDLLALARRFPAQRDVLLAQASASLEVAAKVHYALCEAVVDFDDGAFFEHIGRPRPTSAPLAVEALVPVPGGTFQMGGTADDDEQPIHPVTVSAFALGRTTVTRRQFAEFDADHTCPGGDDHPVSEVSWYVARLFCIWAGGRLSTEAEWEYACRAGSTTEYCFGDDPAELDNYAWQAGEDHDLDKDTQPVGQKNANAWGLFDLHGNVWEWCADWFADTYGSEAAVTNPVGPATGSRRVHRGGAAWLSAGFCRSACRGTDSPQAPSRELGFRLARPAPPPLDSGS